MNVEKKYTAIIIGTKKNNDSVDINLSYGEVADNHNILSYPEEIFDTEGEAIMYAQKKDKYARWMIVPIISFK